MVLRRDGDKEYAYGEIIKEMSGFLVGVEGGTGQDGKRTRLINPADIGL